MFYDPKLTREDIIKNLKDLDDKLYEIYIVRGFNTDDKIEMVVCGSSSLMLNDNFMARSEDIDIIRMNRSIPEEELSKHNISTRAMGMEFGLPYNYLDRIKEVDLDTKVLKIYTFLKKMQ